MITEQFLVGSNSTSNIPQITPPSSGIAPTGEGPGMVGPEHSHLVNQQFLCCGKSTRHVAHLPPPVSHFIAGSKGVRVVTTQLAVSIDSQGCEIRNSAINFTRLSSASTQSK
ncbi:hypothetical protein Srubr_40600 [Streptomyces rubradiris]|uniref:Uncharacterized protein n=1 Tax=Streptomyces rubradiris TaxID=285531 RepID=A0ABQ3REC6_STRRR|nr:hypothetical protein GCM10018792_11670 [Streptomyces rubradiris]GHI54214.1 hypothetical protein Srubr_40600 [Streptomyces rubradiris]